MVVFFLLLLLVVQVGFLIGARMLTMSAVEAAARRAAASSTPLGERDRVVSEILASVPGSEVVDATVTVRTAEVAVEVVVHWTPPGPDLVPVRFDVGASRLRVVPP